MSILTKKKHRPQESNKYAEYVNRVLATTNYALFGEFEGNRRIKPIHVKRLMSSFAENYLPVPIVVDERYRIGDGQNRFEACKELEYPVYYIIIPGLTLKDVQRLNANVKPWSVDDYLESFLELGENHNYALYRDFKERYGFNHNECLIILTEMHKQGEEWLKFKDGAFNIANIQHSNDIAQKIMRVGKYYDGFKRRSFIYAMIGCFGNDSYCHDTFLKKLSKQSAKLTDQAGTIDYLKVIESIYNFRIRESSKIRLF